MNKYFNNFLIVATIAFFYFISGKLSFFISNNNDIVTIVIFMAEGFALAGAILFGRVALFGIFIGQFLLAYSSGLGILPTLFISAINTSEAFLAIVLFKKFHLHSGLLTRKDLFGLILLIVFVLQPYSAILGNVTLYSFSLIKSDDIFSSLFSWWFGNSMGQVLTTPFLLYLYTQYKDINKLEFIAIGAFFFVISYLFLVVFQIDYLSLFSSITMPILIYITYKRNLSYALFGIIIISLTSIISTHLHVGVFASDDNIKNIISLNFFILSHLLLIMIIGILFEENRQQLIENIKQNEKLLEAEKLNSLLELMGNIAHQWRQPLSLISTAATGMQMQKEFGMLSDEAFSQTCEKINNNAQSLSKIINDFTKELKNNTHIILSSFYVEDIVEQFIQTQQKNIKEYNLNIILDIDDIEITSDGQQLGVCFLNIFTNAIDAFEDNNIKERYIFISAKSTKDTVSIVLKDTAGGIDEKIISKIFEPYFTTKHQSQGKGLGLHIVYNIIVKKLKGDISVENINIDYQGQEYKGAQFEIKLPFKITT